MTMIGATENNTTTKLTGRMKMNTAVGKNLEDRHIVAGFHFPLVSEYDGTATFLLWNLSGQIVGFQQYRPFVYEKNTNNPRDARYFTITKPGTVVVWGCEYLHLSPNVVFVTEGIFDAARFHKYGYSAIATLGSSLSNDTVRWLHSLSRTIVTILDNDDAGKKLAKVGHLSFTTITDPSDATEEEIQKIIKSYEAATDQINHLR